jgi:hypothetical protein
MTMKMPFIARTHAAIAALSVAGLLAGAAAPVAAEDYDDVDDNYVGCLTPGGTITRVGLGMPLGGNCPTNHIEISLGGAAAGKTPLVNRYAAVEQYQGDSTGQFSLIASCEEGEQLLSGGARVFTTPLGNEQFLWRLIESGPDPLNNDAWQASFFLTDLMSDAETAVLEVFAYCTSDIDIDLLDDDE